MVIRECVEKKRAAVALVPEGEGEGELLTAVGAPRSRSMAGIHKPDARVSGRDRLVPCYSWLRRPDRIRRPDGRTFLGSMRQWRAASESGAAEMRDGGGGERLQVHSRTTYSVVLRMPMASKTEQKLHQWELKMGVKRSRANDVGELASNSSVNTETL